MPDVDVDDVLRQVRQDQDLAAKLHELDITDNSITRFLQQNRAEVSQRTAAANEELNRATAELGFVQDLYTEYRAQASKTYSLPADQASYEAWPQLPSTFGRSRRSHQRQSGCC